MGESRGGEGRSREATTANVVALIYGQLYDEDREPAEIRAQRVTEGLYAVHVTLHGEVEPESYFLRLSDDPHAPDPPAPSGPSTPGGEA